MRATDVVANCPFDGCPMKPFAKVKAPPGYTIALHGCRYCNFNYVVAVASNATGRAWPVGQWSYNTNAGLYVLVKEYGPNPPRWLELVCSALPQRQQEHTDKEPT